MPEESTTPDLVEAFRPSLEAIDRRDWDAAMAVYGPDAVWDMSLQGMGVFEGRDAVRGLIEDWWGVYEDSEQRVEELRDVGNGVAFAVAVTRGRLPGSAGRTHRSSMWLPTDPHPVPGRACPRWRRPCVRP
jgi:ketosteroid isomerase-like protein